jgi:hypothetical protein
LDRNVGTCERLKLRIFYLRSMKTLQNWKQALGIYLLWATGHLLIFWLRPPVSLYFDTCLNFWPLYSNCDSPFSVGNYNETELGIYLAIPVVLYLSFTLIFFGWKPKMTNETFRDESKLEKQIHILEGLIMCSDTIEEVARIISTSTTRRQAIEALMTELALSELQAIAIMSAELQRFTKVEYERLRDELGQLTKELRDSKSKFPFEGTSKRHPAPGESPRKDKLVTALLVGLLIFGGPIGYALVQLFRYLSE